MVKRLIYWWNTTCSFCHEFRQIIADVSKIAIYILTMGLVGFFILGIYWLFIDISPVVYYGGHGMAEFRGENIIFHLDATRLRDCPVRIRRKIGGCGQIDIPETIGTTPVGQKAPPVSFPLSALFQQYDRQMLSGNVCNLISIAEGYCNPAQRLLGKPIISVSPPIQFIPVARMKSMPPEEFTGP